MSFKFLSAAAAIAAAPLAATAGNIAEPVPTPTIAPVAPAAVDWSGAYVGLSYGSVSGDIDFIPSPAREMDSGSIVGLFGGYQFQRGAWVYGGELTLNSVNDTAVTGFAGTSEVTEMTDLKGRVGYATGDFLFYGVLGYSSGTYDDDIGVPNRQWDIDGLNYGAGVDYAITNNFLVGAEYLIRDLDGPNPSGSGQTVDVDYDSISLRATYKF